MANRKMLEDKILGIQGYTEVVVLPEMFSTGFSMNPAKLAEPMHGETVEWMKEIAAKKRIILTGSLIVEEEGMYYNRLLWVLPNGQIGQYDKRHLFAYAQEDKFYAPGNRRLIASVKGWKINLQICYDLRFPVWARQSAPPLPTVEQMEKGLENKPEYDLLIYVANWPEKRSLAWKSLLVARAIENQSYVVGVNRTGTDGNEIYYSGDSMIVDPLGNILYSKEHEEDVFSTTLNREELDRIRSRFPFLRDADNFFIEP